MAVEMQPGDLKPGFRVRKRHEIPVEHTWDLTLIYPDDAAWEAEFHALEGRTQEIAAIQGTVGHDASSLLRALRVGDDVEMRLYRLFAYARMRRDADGTDPGGQAMESRAGSLVARMAASLSFIEPEILIVPPEKLAAWQHAEPGLEPYAYYLEQLNRRRPHVRSAEVESVMAQYGDVTRTPSETFEMLSDVDLSFPTIDDENGNPVQLSNARYGLLVMNKDRRVRRDAFMGIHNTYAGVARTCATTLGGAVRSHVLESRLRSYPSALAAALEPNDIPLEVYRNLIDTVRRNSSHLHRYLRVRKRLLGLQEIHLYDLFAPLVPELDDHVDYVEGKELMLAAFRPLGEEYAGALRHALEDRWIDVYENEGKTSGAYSGGSYSTPPFILMNFQDRLIDVYTLAHELGHSMHSYFTRRSQPFVTGRYTIFVAEVASTLNEVLLTAHLLATRDDPSLRKRLIVEQLESIRSTLFRQTMFAQFELDIHERVEAGEALTADFLSRRYRELVASYYGPDLALDDEVASEWARIPHFYFNFYVYQYATGVSAAQSLATQILEEGQPAVERYLRFLRSGSSRPPIELLREAGVDMASPQPIQQAMDRFDGLLDELEAIEP